MSRPSGISSSAARRDLPSSCRRSLSLLCAGLLLPAAAVAATLRVPTDQPTIQAAIDAAQANDSILVAEGIYDENLNTHGKYLSLIAEAGPAFTVIDGGQRNSVVVLSGGGVIQGFNIRNGWDYQEAYRGGGIRITGTAPVVIRDNIIERNQAGPHSDLGLGGGIFLTPEAPNVLITDNTIQDNYAGDSGGGIYDYGVNRLGAIARNVIARNGCHVSGGGVYAGIVTVTNNLILENWADYFGGGVYVEGGTVDNNTIVGNSYGSHFQEGAGIHFEGGTVRRNVVARNHGVGAAGVGIACRVPGQVIECNDAWGNAGSDYAMFYGCDTTGGHNFSADPLFCDEVGGDYRLGQDSPCADGSTTGCGLVGAYGVACGPTRVERTTWGRLKVIYR